jgi:hypothetical protein
MSGYHITPSRINGQSRRLRCVAGPGNCKYGDAPHFETKAAAEQFLKFQDDVEVDPRLVNLHSTHPGVEQAIHSSLNYRGKQPRWWRKFERMAAGHKDLPVKPELLDVIDSPVGPLAVVWQNLSHDGNDIPVELNRGSDVKLLSLISMKTGEREGYLKLTSKNWQSMARSYGTGELLPFRYQQKEASGGLRYEAVLEGADPASMSEAEREQFDRKLWLTAVDVNKGYYENEIGRAHSMDLSGVDKRNGIKESLIPADINVVRADLAEFAELINRQIDAARVTYEQPYVDQSRIVKEELQGHGLGSVMYVYGARKLATQGLAIRASGLQTPQAKAAWARFAKHFPAQFKIYTAEDAGKTYEARLLDFR